LAEPFLGIRTDFNPENIDHLINSYTGGLGKFIGNSVNTIVTAGKGDIPEPHTVPVFRQLTKAASKYKARSTVYDMIKKSGLQVYPKDQIDRFHRNVRYAVENDQMTPDQAQTAIKRFRKTQEDARLSKMGVTSSIRKEQKSQQFGRVKPPVPPKPKSPPRPLGFGR